MTITNDSADSQAAIHFDFPDAAMERYVRGVTRRKSRQWRLNGEDSRALMNAILEIAIKARDETDPEPAGTFRRRWQGRAKRRMRALRDFRADIVTRPGWNMSTWDQRQIDTAHARAIDELPDAMPDERQKRAREIYTLGGGAATVFESESGQMVWLDAAVGPHEAEATTWHEVTADSAVDVEDTAVRHIYSQQTLTDLAASDLTDRQKMVAQLLEKGDKPVEIARMLGRSKSTISADMDAIGDYLTWRRTENQ